MPTLELDEMELATAARGARCLAAQVRSDAERQTNPSQRAIFEHTVKYHEAMAAKFEKARSPASPTPRKR
jgi:hypothetical protein